VISHRREHAGSISPAHDRCLSPVNVAAWLRVYRKSPLGSSISGAFRIRSISGAARRPSSCSTFGWFMAVVTKISNSAARAVA